MSRDAVEGMLALAHPMGTLYQCQRCPYNTLSVEYARGHVCRATRVENTPVEAETSPAQEPAVKVPVRNRRVKKER